MVSQPICRHAECGLVFGLLYKKQPRAFSLSQNTIESTETSRLFNQPNSLFFPAHDSGALLLSVEILHMALTANLCVRASASCGDGIELGVRIAWRVVGERGLAELWRDCFQDGPA